MKKAAAQYSKAYDYYQHSKWRRADAIALLEDMARVQMDINAYADPPHVAEHDEAVAAARKLIAQKKFVEGRQSMRRISGKISQQSINFSSRCAGVQ